MITRVAPTPSGFLHAGNAVNALLTSWLARQQGLIVALRIDDMDAPRYRPEYVEDAIGVLDWLGIGWTAGPHSREEFEQSYSLRQRTDYYRAELTRAQEAGLEVYACRCTRASAAAAGGRGCVGDCRTAAYPAGTGASAMRAHLGPGIADPILWRRDDLPAYHLASLVEDRDLGTTHVVRGEDLRESTRIQIALAGYLGATAFARATFIHHPLVVGDDGRKLSKSQLSDGPMTRNDTAREAIVARAMGMSERLGIYGGG
jgi:glutamyl-tRNA synthetase